MEDICKRLPCISLIPECGQSIRHLHISHFSHYMIYLGFPPNIAHKHCLQFLLGAGRGGRGQTRCITGDMQMVNSTPVYFTSVMPVGSLLFCGVGTTVQCLFNLLYYATFGDCIRPQHQETSVK